MATLKKYLRPDLTVSGLNHMAVQDTSPGSNANTGTGWVLGTVAAGNYARADSLTKRTSDVFTSTAQPSGVPNNTLGDSFVLPNLTGTFASAQWTFSFPVLSTSAGFSGSFFPVGNLRVRVWKTADNTNFTELTSAVLETNSYTSSTTTEGILTVSWTPTQFSMSAESLYVQIAWEITTEGVGNDANDVLLRVGSGAHYTTSDFSQTTGDREFIGMLGL